MQCVLRWHTKIEEISPILHYIEGPHNILASNLSRLHHLVTLAQIAEGKKLVEPAEVSNEEEDEGYFLHQEYSGLYDEDVWECIECYVNLPTLHIRMIIRWIMHTFMNYSNRTNNCLLSSTSEISRQLCQLTSGWHRWWHHLLWERSHSTVKLRCLNQWYLILSNGSTKWWDILVKRDYKRC